MKECATNKQSCAILSFKAQKKPDFVCYFLSLFELRNLSYKRDYPNEPYAGYYKLLKPSIIARDPELLKDILITNFNSFRNNDVAISKKYDKLGATNPFVKEDDDWRDARKSVSPMFSQIKVSTNQSDRLNRTINSIIIEISYN